MAQQSKIAELGAMVNGGSLPVSELTIQIAVNTVPTCAITSVPQTDSVVGRPFASDILDMIRDRQQKRLAGRDAPDIRVDVTDGLGGSLAFSGFFAAPTIVLSKHAIADTFTALGLDSALDGMDLGIYRPDPPSTRPGETGNGLMQALPVAKSGDVPALLSEITGILLENYDLVLGETTVESMRQLTVQQHAQNIKLPIGLWNAILDGSDVVYESWAAAAAANESVAMQMVNQTKDMLQQRGSGFWDVIRGLLAGFQMIYVPSTQGSGFFRRMDVRVAEETTQEVALHLTSINVSDGSSRIMQIGGVVMYAPSALTTRPETTFPETIAGQYPRPLIDGYIHREPPPVWMVDNTGVPIVGSSEDKRPPAGEAETYDYDLASYEARRDSAETFREAADGSMTGILDEVCRIFFKDYQYADSTASLTIPLDLTIRVGERTKFTIPDGGSFSGFVSGISHRIALTGGKQLDSYTRLDVTHIIY